MREIFDIFGIVSQIIFAAAGVYLETKEGILHLKKNYDIFETYLDELCLKFDVKDRV